MVPDDPQCNEGCPHLSKSFISEVVDAAVTSTLTRLGVTVDDPHEVQRDMAYLRDLRTNTDRAKLAIFGAIFTAAIGLVTAYLSGLFTSGK